MRGSPLPLRPPLDRPSVAVQKTRQVRRRVVEALQARPGGLAELERPARFGGQFIHGPGERPRRTGRYEQAAFAVGDQLRDATHGGGDRGHALRRRFEDRHRAVLVPPRRQDRSDGPPQHRQDVGQGGLRVDDRRQALGRDPLAQRSCSGPAPNSSTRAPCCSWAVAARRSSRPFSAT